MTAVQQWMLSGSKRRGSPCEVLLHFDSGLQDNGLHPGSWTLYREPANTSSVTGGKLLLNNNTAGINFISLIHANGRPEWDAAGDFCLELSLNTNTGDPLSIYASSDPANLVGSAASPLGISDPGEWRFYNRYDSSAPFGRVFVFSYIPLAGSAFARTVKVNADATSAHQWAVSRVAGVLRLFRDGVLVDTAAGSNNDPVLCNTNGMGVGYLTPGNSSFLNHYGKGYFDELRWTVGNGRYTGSYTPESAFENP